MDFVTCRAASHMTIFGVAQLSSLSDNIQVRRHFGISKHRERFRLDFDRVSDAIAWVNHGQALQFPNLNLNPNGDAGYPLAPLRGGCKFSNQTRLDPFSESNASGIGWFDY